MAGVQGGVMWGPLRPARPLGPPRPCQVAVCLRTHCSVIVLFIAVLPAMRPLAAPWPLPSCWFVTFRLYLDSSIPHSHPFLYISKSGFVPGGPPVTTTNPVLSAVPPASRPKNLFLRLFPLIRLDQATGAPCSSSWSTPNCRHRSTRSNSPTRYGTVYF